MELTEWLPRVDRYLRHLERLFSPDLFIFGGGISKRFDDFGDVFTSRAPVVPAELRNQAGIVGAALAAYERFG
ncbi:MAG: ROK family protein, partial [Acidimicrobiia bacterium]|nr:ROK family protein [Acidimicrobiia bacterium]